MKTNAYVRCLPRDFWRLVPLLIGLSPALATIDSKGAAPRVEIVQPEAEQMFASPASIEIVVIARDPDGYVPKVEFFEGKNKIGEMQIVFLVAPPPGEEQTFSMIWSNVPVGRYQLSAVATDDSGQTSSSAVIPIRVVDPCRVPVVSIEATDKFAREQEPCIFCLPMENVGVFRVSRTCGTNFPLMVSYTVSGTASNGVHYTRLPGSIVIPAGATDAALVIIPFNDHLVEETETIKICLDPSLCPPDDASVANCYLLGEEHCSMAYLEDDDQSNSPPRVSVVSPPDGSVFLGPADVRLAATASDRDGRIQTVEFFANGVSLGIGAKAPLVWEPLPHDASADVIDIPIIPLYSLVWSNAPVGQHRVTAVATDNSGESTTSDAIQIIVSERESTVVTIEATDPTASEELPRPMDPTIRPIFDWATFTVKREGPTRFPLTVFYRVGGTAVNGVDYREIGRTIEIPVGESTARITIAPIDDKAIEGNETVEITIESPICIEIFPPPPECYEVGRQRTARAVIHDDDQSENSPPQVRLVNADGEVFLAPAAIELTAFAQDREDAFELKVEFFEGTNSLGFGTFNPTRCADICPNFILTWSNVPPGRYVISAMATDGAGLSTLSTPIHVAVLPVREPAVVNIEASDSEGREIDPRLDRLPDPARFSLTRSGPTETSLIVYLRIAGTASNGVDYEFRRDHIRFPEGESSVEIPIDVIDDLLCEGDETVVIEILPPLCVPIFPPPQDCYLVGRHEKARAVIHDNELCPSNKPPRVEIVGPVDGDMFVAPADINLCATARDPDGIVVNVEFFSNEIPLGPADLATGTDRVCLHWSMVAPGAYTLKAVATDNSGATATSGPVRIEVSESLVQTIVTIEAIDSTGSEGPALIRPLDDSLPLPRNDPLVFLVTRSGGTNIPLTVFYAVSGSASNGVDYRTLSGEISFAIGQSSKRIVVEPIDDAFEEKTESVILTLVPPACPAIFPPPPECYAVGMPGSAEGSIRDNDPSPNIPPRVAILVPSDGELFAAGSDIDIRTVALDPDGWVGKVEFFAGPHFIGVREIVFIQPPPPGELQEFSLVWSNVPPDQYTLTARATDDNGAVTVSGPIAIAVVDSCAVPLVTVHPTDPMAAEPNPFTDGPEDTATFTIRRSCQLNTPLRVRYELTGTALNGVDYHQLGGEVLIPAGETSAPVLVRPLDDDLVEGTESVILHLIEIRCANTDGSSDECYLVGNSARATVYIRDNDGIRNLAPRVAISSPHAGQSFESPANIPVMALATDPDGWVPRVEFFVDDVSIGVSQLNFLVARPPGEIQVHEIQWGDVPPGRYVLTAKATDDQGAMARSEPVTIEVIPIRDVPAVNVIPLDSIAREGSDNTAIFRLRRSGPTNSSLTVHFDLLGEAKNGVDYEEIPSSVTIPAGRRSVRVIIAATEDHQKEGIESVILRLKAADSYDLGIPASVAAIILDQDQLLPRCRLLNDRLMVVCLAAPQGLSYRLETSSDLKNWEAVMVNVAGDDGLHFVDPDSAGHGYRFYRVQPDFEQFAVDD